jgi:predicted dehydrogenase
MPENHWLFEASTNFCAGVLAPQARLVDSLDSLLETDLDGVVIATPSALHADQASAALERGLAVFCQKPLARTAAETQRVVAAARRANRLLGVDLSYRFVRGIVQARDLIRSGELGELYAAELTFHNAYGPDKPWFYEVEIAGGGCVMDLGTHLVDLALWSLDFPWVDSVSSRLYKQGRLLARPIGCVEDYAVAQLDLANGATVRLACSWRLPAGQDAVIQATFYGTQGGVALRNVNGSFYDFIVERFRGTRRETLATYPDPWGGRALLDWARRLPHDNSFNPESERLVEVAAVLDRIYGR